jgi:hypothetical protein
MPWRQRRLGRAAAVACGGAAIVTITMAVPAAAASGPGECPGIDVRDPLQSVKCPVDSLTQQALPSRPATAVPTKSPAPDRTSAPAAKRSGGDRPARPAAVAPADGRVRGGARDGGSATGLSPMQATTGLSPMPASMQLPQVEPSYPYPQVVGDPGRGRPAGRAAAAEGIEDAAILWVGGAAALVAALCALHLGVASRLLQAADQPLS